MIVFPVVKSLTALRHGSSTKKVVHVGLDPSSLSTLPVQVRIVPRNLLMLLLVVGCCVVLCGTGRLSCRIEGGINMFVAKTGDTLFSVTGQEHQERI